MNHFNMEPCTRDIAESCLMASNCLTFCEGMLDSEQTRLYNRYIVKLAKGF